MAFRFRAVCAASIAALAFSLPACGADESAKDDAAKKYCKTLDEQLDLSAESLEQCVEGAKKVTSKDIEDIERELDKVNEQLKTLPDELEQDLERMKKQARDGE